MNITSLFTKVKKAFFRVLAFFPSKLPIGDAKFEAWYADIAWLYDLPTDNDSIRFALGTSIMHLPPTAFYTSKRHFGLLLLKGAAQQQAYNIMGDCKIRQDAKKKLEEQQKANPPQLAAVTAPPSAVGVDHGQPGQS